MSTKIAHGTEMAGNLVIKVRKGVVCCCHGDENYL